MTSRKPTFGLEEEVVVIDCQSLAPVTPRQSCLDDLSRKLGRRFTLEYKACAIELVTQVHNHPFSLVEEAAANRFEAGRVLASHGYAALPMAIHPTAHPVDLPAREGPRYRRIEQQKGDAVHNLAAQGVHLHVGTFPAESEERLRLLPMLMHLVPLQAAITAASPFCAGRDTCQASWRLRVLMQLSSALPLLAESSAEYYRISQVAAQAGGAADASEQWGLLRLGAGKPTIEFRAADTTPSLESTPWLAALIGAAVDAGRQGRLPRIGVSLSASASIFIANLERVTAEGCDALLVDPVDLEVRSVRDTVSIWVGRLEHHIDALGYGDAIALIPDHLSTPARQQRGLVRTIEADARERGLAPEEARLFALSQLKKAALEEARRSRPMPWLDTLSAA